MDLRFENLTLADNAYVARNAKLRTDSVSGIKGVSWNKGRQRWIASIYVGGERISLGQHKTKEDAARAVELGRQEHITPDAPKMSPEAKEKSRIAGKFRGLWKRTLRNAGHVTGWKDFDAFRAEIADEPKNFAMLLPVNTEKMIGPGNWKWETSLYSQFDMSTREGKTAYERAYREKNPFVKKAHDLRKTFNLSLADYQKMFVAQGGVCASCGHPEHEQRSGKTRWLAVDHDHETGDIRGLLCGSCNRGIGKFSDDPALLRKAADYLERFKEKQKTLPKSNILPFKT